MSLHSQPSGGEDPSVPVPATAVLIADNDVGSKPALGGRKGNGSFFSYSATLIPAIILVLLLVAYPLSPGPLGYVAGKPIYLGTINGHYYTLMPAIAGPTSTVGSAPQGLGGAIIRILYYPLLLLYHNSPEAEQTVQSYLFRWKCYLVKMSPPSIAPVSPSSSSSSSGPAIPASTNGAETIELPGEVPAL
ncbi:MAG TPA: hypothetical protein VK970_20305 [Candidatus Methylacidiphilales bacterium]|nr:hypothetical protein [Candidatus Methylacidiphilales bacterium]